MDIPDPREVFVFPDDQDLRVHRATPEERSVLAELVSALRSSLSEDGYAELRLRQGRPGLALPRPVLEALAAAAAMMMDGDPVEVRVAGGTLTVEEAADLLGVAPAEVEALIDRGDLPHRDQTEPRLSLDDVLGFGRQEKAKRRAAMDVIAEIGQEEWGREG
jgi:excisionase family DNA binding protein